MKREGADNGSEPLWSSLSCLRPPLKRAREARMKIFMCLVVQVASGRIVNWFQQKGYG